jgi:hypothetical protein
LLLSNDFAYPQVFILISQLMYNAVSAYNVFIMKILGSSLVDKKGNQISRGMNNRAQETAIPPGQLRNAVNVDYDDQGNIFFTREGYSIVVATSGSHSWFENEDAYGFGLFVGGASLMRLNADNTATTLKTVGDAPMSYCLVDGAVYFSNRIFSGKYKGGSVYEWGVAVPNNLFVATPIPSGGMYGGDYLVALTWLSDGEESGADSSVRVTVPDGGGINLSNLPAPPDYVDTLAVYVSPPDGEELYLYDEFEPDTAEIFVSNHIGTVEIETQFAVKAQPGLGLTLYKGRIYWIDGKLIRHTEAQAYGLQRVDNLIPFEEAVTNIIRTQGFLVVATEKAFYAVSGIDTDSMAITKLKNYGATPGTVCYDEISELAYAMSHAGIVEISAQGVKELHFDRVATPMYKKGTLALIEHNGVRKLVFVGQGGVVAKLQDNDYTNDEITRKGNGL